MEGQDNQNATAERSTPILLGDSSTRPTENPESPVTATSSPPASGIPTEMVVKLFQFLEPNLDAGKLLAQFMANSAIPQQREETLSKAQELENVATGGMQEEQRGGEETRSREDEASEVPETPRQDKPEVKPTITEARRAEEPTTRVASDVLSKADPQEGGTRKRRYHKIVVELSEEEDGPQLPLVKRPQTGIPTTPKGGLQGKRLRLGRSCHSHHPTPKRKARGRLKS